MPNVIHVPDENHTHVTIGGGCEDGHAVETVHGIRGFVCRFCEKVAGAFGYEVHDVQAEAEGHETVPEPETPTDPEAQGDPDEAQGDEEASTADAGDEGASADAQTSADDEANDQAEAAQA